MNERVVRYMLRLATAGMVFVAVSGPAPAAAQSVEIWPGTNIQQVVNSRAAGTTFVLKSGVHRLQSIAPRSGDRFLGEPGTVLSGAWQLTSFGRSGAYWFVGGQTQQGARGGACDPGYPRCGYPENFYIDGQPLRHVDSIGAVGPGTFFFDYAADRIYFVDDPTNRTVEASVTAKAFEGFATDVLISGLVIEKYATPGRRGGGGRRNALDPSVFRDQAEPLRRRRDRGPNPTLHHNSIHHNGCFGIIGAGNYATVEYNEIAYNNFARFNPYWGAGGTKFVYTVGLTVRGNSSHHNGGPGLWTDIGNIYTLYENNTVEDNERGGIFHELSYDATIRYNTARRNGVATSHTPTGRPAPASRSWTRPTSKSMATSRGQLAGHHRSGRPSRQRTIRSVHSEESLRPRQPDYLAFHRARVGADGHHRHGYSTPPTSSGTTGS